MYYIMKMPNKYSKTATQMKNILKIYKNKKVLITGATGFKGAWLSLWLQGDLCYLYFHKAF